MARRSGGSCCATTRCWTLTWTWGRSSTSSGSQGPTWCFTTDPLDRDAAATRHLLIIAQQLQTQPGDTSYKVNSIKPLHLNTIPRIGWPYSHHLPKTTYNVHCGNQCWWRCAETPSAPLRRCWGARHCHRGTTPLQWHRSNTMSRENVWRSYWKLCIVIVLKCQQILNYVCPSNCYMIGGFWFWENACFFNREFKESSGIATWRLQFPIDLHSYNVMSVKVKLSKM